MGMFDRLYINTDKLPVSDEEKVLIGKDRVWQTKSLDCDLTEVYITDENELKVNRWEYESVPKEERPYPDDEGFLGTFGSIKRVNERLEVVNHHGYVRFYCDVNQNWYEFSAKFTDGKLVNIEKEK